MNSSHALTDSDGCLALKFLAVESKMAKPQKFIGWFGVLDIAALVVVISYIIFGIFGYWRYGEGVAASLTLNLPDEP